MMPVVIWAYILKDREGTTMSIFINHLPRNVDLSDKKITLLSYMFYVGKAVSNLEESIFYRNLPPKEYKCWLRQEIKAKSDIYTALTSIKYIALAEQDITLVCSCSASNPSDCVAITIRKVIAYLLAEDLAFGFTND